MNPQTLETKPSRDVLDQVFLSPRVLDKTAFEEFAGVMKQLIERATDDTKKLETAAAHAETVQKKLAETAPLIEARLTGAGEVIRSLDTRTAEVRAALGKAAESAVTAQTAKAEIEQLIRDCPAQFEARLTAATEQSLTTLQSVKARVEGAAQELGESALRAMEVADVRLKDVESLSAARIGAMADQAERVILGLEARLEEVSQRITTLAGAGLSGIQTLCDRAEAILGRDLDNADATPQAGSLAAAIAKAEHVEAVLGEACEQTLVLAGYGSAESIDPTEPCVVAELPAVKAKRAAKTKHAAKLNLAAKPNRKPANGVTSRKARRAR